MTRYLLYTRFLFGGEGGLGCRGRSQDLKKSLQSCLKVGVPSTPLQDKYQSSSKYTRNTV